MSEIETIGRGSRRRLSMATSVVLLASVVGACSSDEKKVIADNSQVVCFLAASAADALAGWMGGSLPKGLDNACDGLLKKWAAGGPAIKLQVDAGTPLIYTLPKFVPQIAAQLPPNLQVLLDQMSADLNNLSSGG